VRNTRSRINYEGSNLRPAWTPDDEKLIFASRSNLSNAVLVSPADNSSPPSILAEHSNLLLPTSVSPVSLDGETVILLTDERAINYGEGIVVMPLSTRAPTVKPQIYMTSQFRKSSGVFSPDGRWVAYVSMDSGRPEIYVTAY